MIIRRTTVVLLGALLVCLAACSDESSEDESASRTEITSTTAAAATAAPTTTAVSPSGKETAEALADAWVAAWAAGDPAAVAAVFTESGTYVDTMGNTFVGTQAIERNASGGNGPIDPARIGYLRQWGGNNYRFLTRFGWQGNTYVEDVEIQVDGDHASRIAWMATPDKYLGLNDQLFEAEYSGTAEVTEGDWCEEGQTPVQVAVSGSEAGLGFFQAAARHCTDPGAGEILNGSVVITTVDGDELHGTYEGRITAENPDGSLDARLVQTYDSGTGRFADASGIAEEPCHILFFSEAQAVVNGALKGTLTYSED